MAAWNVDPDEFAEAVRDGMLAGGASADVANVEAELGRVHAIAYNETPDSERWVLTREERQDQVVDEDPTPHPRPASDEWADWDDAERQDQLASIEAEYGPEVEEERASRPAGQLDRCDDDCDGW